MIIMNNRLLNEYLSSNKNKKLSNFISKILICLIVLFTSLIYTSKSESNLKLFKSKVFDNTFNFSKFKKYYQKLGGVPVNSEKEKLVSNTELDYLNAKKYKDGYVIDLLSETPIKAISSGVVVFVGKKEGLGNTIIVQGSDGYDIWYGMLDNIDIKIYDYITSGSSVGLSSNKLYFKIIKDNKTYSYEEYKTK